MNDFATLLSPTEIRFERLLPGPIETVWAFLTDSNKRGEWFASGPMELKVGGKVELFFKHSDLSPHNAAPPQKFEKMDTEGHRAELRITEIVAPRRLAFTWDDGSEVVFDLAPRGDKVLLTLTHCRIPRREDMVGTAGGWHCHLAILVDKAHGRMPPAFWDVFRKYDGEYDRRIPQF
ncbi:Activator of Hsp90 ATPase homolog 1-like protein [Enhydrobacter aerosaccus]|uniref:Activator of Hsp90 ATPase homolog 1-like protein n=1 Tax=Enhydrobacter aerosaccus TaxID=225324 RepID=A0A1T4MX08_9HYPH|nr:SRPBCC family protein [Enhydrobacter aerosaccus]SJZ71315.1 Activator of Hsp90 ATPase homolog 1-like protein [Enhydrobacter aerosaccus]